MTKKKVRPKQWKIKDFQSGDLYVWETLSDKFHVRLCLRQEQLYTGKLVFDEFLLKELRIMSSNPRDDSGIYADLKVYRDGKLIYESAGWENEPE